MPPPGGMAPSSPGRRPSTPTRSAHNGSQDPIQFRIRPRWDQYWPMGAPPLKVTDRFARRERRDRPERLQLQDLFVGEGLEAAAQIGVRGRRRGRFITLQEQLEVQQVSSPTIRVIGSKLL